MVYSLETWNIQFYRKNDETETQKIADDMRARERVRVLILSTKPKQSH